MSEYPKVIELFGRRNLLGHAGRSFHRADSAEDEARIRAEHERLNKEANAQLDELYAKAFPRHNPFGLPPI